MGEWIDAAQKIGIPAAILVFLGICAWKTGKWVGRELIIPARDHFFGRVTEAFDHINETLATIQHTLTEMSAAARTTTKTAVAGARAVEKAVSKMDETRPQEGV